MPAIRIEIPALLTRRIKLIRNRHDAFAPSSVNECVFSHPMKKQLQPAS